MSVSMNLSRSSYIEAIANAEVEMISNVCIEHIAVPMILGVSMDFVTQEDFNKKFPGPKPEPLSDAAKREIYDRMRNFLKPKILEKTRELVNSVLSQSLDSLTDEQLSIKVTEINAADLGPRWDTIHALFKDEAFLFKALQGRSALKADFNAFHDALCPIVSSYRDSGELYFKVRMSEFF